MGKAKAPAGRKMYVPKQGSGGYAILLALRQMMDKGDMVSSFSKDDIIEVAQQWSTSGFEKKAGTYYGPWDRCGRSSFSSRAGAVG